MVNNKKSGTAFEREFAQLLAQHGFWVHLLKDNHNGQPFDVIAAKDKRTYVFDCKDCKNGIFVLTRIEENQKLAMRLWQECGNRQGVFALRTPSGIRMLPYTDAMDLISVGYTRLAGIRIYEHTETFEEWLENEDNDQ